MMYLIMPPRNGMSVPERMGAYTSALAAVRVKRGSTTTSFAPRCSLAFMIHFMEMGWFSAGLDPITRMTSAFLTSIQWFVIAPRPNDSARAATVGEAVGPVHGEVLLDLFLRAVGQLFLDLGFRGGLERPVPRVLDLFGDLIERPVPFHFLPFRSARGPVPGLEHAFVIVHRSEEHTSELQSPT